jgi:hypothetical protein
MDDKYQLSTWATGHSASGGVQGKTYFGYVVLNTATGSIVVQKVYHIEGFTQTVTELSITK